MVKAGQGANIGARRLAAPNPTMTICAHLDSLNA
jgi:hypothetical protein